MKKSWLVVVLPLLCLVPGAIADKVDPADLVPTWVDDEKKDDKDAKKAEKAAIKLDLEGDKFKPDKLKEWNPNKQVALDLNQPPAEATPVLTPEPATLVLIGY